MHIQEWIALGALIFTLVGTAAAVYGKLCALATRVDGLLRKIEDMAGSIRRLFEFWDERPCDAHTVEIANLKERLGKIETEKKLDVRGVK